MVNNERPWQNPFEKSLVEDWRLEEFPQNYKEMVSCFISPEFMDKLTSIEIKPKILIGGRGTGKSHILRMVSIHSVINRIKIEKAKNEGKSPYEIKLKLEDYKEQYFGVYLKATLFSPLSTTNVTYLSEDQLRTLFEHLFNMQVSIAILDAVKFLTEACEDIPREKEKIICLKLYDKLNPIVKGRTFSEVIDSLDNQVKAIQEITREFPWYNDFSRFKDRISFTTAPNFIMDLFDIIRDEILKHKVLFILIDEYDELDEYQQMFINNLIRTRTLTFRIASKIGGIKTLKYNDDKELDEVHDYDPIIPLHFEISREKRYPYQNLLKNIFIKRLSIYGNYKINDPEKLLRSPTLADEGITEEEIQQELKEIHANLREEFQNTTLEEYLENSNVDYNYKKGGTFEEYWKNYESHYKEAALYRLLRKKGKDKLYAGFDEYVSLSSGIVRQFILLSREAFLLAHARGIAIEKGEPIPLKIQSEAAEKISKNQLLLESTKSIPSGYGPKLVSLIQDLGRILQAKLYYSTEPQANRFEIKGAEKLRDEEYRIPKEIIENGLKMPHFISESAFKPRQPEYSLSFTFSLNGIFAPALKIPPEKRWRTPLTAEELKGLCSSEKREETLRKIISKIKGKKGDVQGKTEEKGAQQRIAGNIHPPISLSNCPITNHGCNQQLTEYIIEVEKLKAFLAVPFNEDSWVYDPRRWVKNAMTDRVNIRCVDVDDFPNVGYVLCKICSCVRQMPIGVFEITELNPNVIFELGMATGLNKLIFMFVYPDKIPRNLKDNYPPKPLQGIEYTAYELSENAISKKIEEKIYPTIKEITKHEVNQWCWILKGECPHKEIKAEDDKILICLPYNRNPEFFEEVEKLLKNMLSKYKVESSNPAQSLSELCQICKEIRGSAFCIVDTTYNDITMLFSLGVAFGKDKKFIQLHNISLSSERPISDLGSWAIEYRNIPELEKKLKEELSKRLEGL